MGKAPSGILKVFLVLPEGEENFIRSPVGDLKSFIDPSMVVVCWRFCLECEPLGEFFFFFLMEKTKPPAGPSPGRRKGVSWAKLPPVSLRCF